MTISEFPDNEKADGKQHSSRPAIRCEAHPRGTILNPVLFEEIASNRADVFIQHMGQLYRLSRTRQDKLILTKAINTPDALTP